MAAGRGLGQEEAAQILRDALQACAASVRVVPREGYEAHMNEAVRRMPRDPRDAATVALALATGSGIWTADLDFFGCGVAVWTTETLQAQLAG